MKVAVIGGGISGLAAAWELRGKADVTVFEPGAVGGCIRATVFGGRPVDEGADAFITRLPDAVRLCEEVGIESELVPPSAGGSMLWWKGRLRPLPEGLMLGVPSQLLALLSGGILSPLGIARAGLDLVLPRRRRPDSLTVRQLVADRFGFEVADRLVDPLVGSIYAGWTGRLGAPEVVPQLVSAAQRSRSLMLALRSAPPSGEGPMFLAPRLGMGRLVEALVESLQKSGTRFLGQAVDSIEAAGKAVVVKPTLETFDAVVVATPARVAARIMKSSLGDEGSPLSEIPTASVVLLTASFAHLELPVGINGFLVPRGSGRLMTACSFGSNKWPRWAAAGNSVVRLSAGRYGDEDVLRLSDAELTGRLLDELRQALGTSLTPLEIRVSRWPHSFPQYLPDHAKRIVAAEDLLRNHLPTVTLAGSSYRGLGIPACIASGKVAADLAITRARMVSR